jgi:pimeloyl-ACP methyl ester carboxylesterase
MSSKIMAEDIEYLCRHLGFESIPVLLGHSHAGNIVLRYAEQHPLRVTKLLLIDSVIHDSPPNDEFERWANKRKDGPVFGPALAVWVDPRNPASHEEFVEN